MRTFNKRPIYTLSEIITKNKIDLISQNAERKSIIEKFEELELLKKDDKGNYYIYSPYSPNAKFPNIEKGLEFLIKIFSHNEINTDNPFEDLESIEQNLKEFEDLKKRNLVPEDIKKKHISKFTYTELKAMVDQYMGRGQSAQISQDVITKTNRNVKLEEVPNVKPPFKVLKVNDVPTAVQLAQGSQWCVRYDSHAKSYLTSNPERGPLYFVYKNDQQFALFSFGTNSGRGELMIPNDTRIRPTIMQEVKDHWADLIKYLHAFDIHEYDADLSNFTSEMSAYVESKKNEFIKNPVIFKYFEILRYNSEPLKDFFTKKDAIYLEDLNVSEDDYEEIRSMDEKSLKKFILKIVKGEIAKAIKELEKKAKVVTSPIIENGQVTINIALGELFSYDDLDSTHQYNKSSVDDLLSKGITDVKKIFETRVKGKEKTVNFILEKLNVILTDSIISEYLVKE